MTFILILFPINVFARKLTFEQKLKRVWLLRKIQELQSYLIMSIKSVIDVCILYRLIITQRHSTQKNDDTLARSFPLGATCDYDIKQFLRNCGRWIIKIKNRNNLILHHGDKKKGYNSRLIVFIVEKIHRDTYTCCTIEFSAMAPFYLRLCVSFA